MELIVTAFGAPAWEVRRGLIRRIIEARPGPPYDFRDALWLVPNERMVKTIRLALLDELAALTGSHGCLPPRIEPLNRFIAARAGAVSPHPVVDELTRTLVIEGLCVEAAQRIGELGLPGTSPEIAGRSLAPAVSEKLAQLAAWGVDRQSFGRHARYRRPAELLAEVWRSYDTWLGKRGLADPYAAKAAYAPSEAEFRSVGSVVLDGFYDADPAEARLMKALLCVPDSVVLVEAPGLSLPEACAEAMPYRDTRALTAALGLPQHADTPDDRAAREAGLFIGALSGGRGLGESLERITAAMPLSADIAVTGALNPAEEAHLIARTIKLMHLEGRLPDMNRVLVLFPEPDRRLPVLERAFEEAGVPYHVSQGRPLMQSPVAAALFALLGLPADGYGFRAMRRAFCSPLVRLAEGGNHPEALGRLGRERRITRGRDAWRGLAGASPDKAGDVELVRGPLTALLELTAPLERDRMPLGHWCDAATALIESSGIRARASEADAAHPGLVAAQDGITDALTRLKESAHVLGVRPTLSGFIHTLKNTLSGMRARPTPDTMCGVRVLGRLEAGSEPFDAVFVGGLVEGSLPAPPAADIFLSAQSAAELSLPGADALRAREARGLLSLVCSAPVVRLSYPESAGRGPTVPSAYVRAFEPFFRAGAIKKDSGAGRPLELDQAASPAELARAVALAASRGAAGVTALEGLGPLMGEGAREALRARTDGRPGRLSPPGRRSFSVTELDEYMLCHYRYYQGRVLGSAPPEEPETDAAPHETGTVVHRILKRFHDERGGPLAGEARADALGLMRRISDEEFARLPQSLRNSEYKRRFDEVIAPGFIEDEAELAASGSEACGAEVELAVDYMDSEFGEIVITGKIDRLELASSGSFVVGDYKTGSYPGAPGSARPVGEQFQLPMYAHMLMERDRKQGKAPPRPAAFVYYDLKRGRMRDVVMYDAAEEDAVATTKSAARRRDLEAVAAEAFRQAAEAVRGILKADFAPTCDKERVCLYCVYAQVCERGAALDTEEAGEGAGDTGGGDGS